MLSQLLGLQFRVQTLGVSQESLSNTRYQDDNIYKISKQIITAKLSNGSRLF